MGPCSCLASNEESQKSKDATTVNNAADVSTSSLPSLILAQDNAADYQQHQQLDPQGNNSTASAPPPISYLEIPFSSSLSSSLGDTSSIFSSGYNAVHHGPKSSPPRGLPTAVEPPMMKAPSSFRLKPRGMVKPSPVSARGRKRSATTSLSLSSMKSGGTPPRCGKSNNSNNNRDQQGSGTDNSSTTSSAISNEDFSGAKQHELQQLAMPLSPGVSLSFQCLSLHSPQQDATDSASSFLKPPALFRETTGTPTSFVSGFARVPSPGFGRLACSPISTDVGGSSFHRFRSSSFDTVGDQSLPAAPQALHNRSNFDASSVGSAPKVVPLTVLTRGASPTKGRLSTTPSTSSNHHKPPLHLVQQQTQSGISTCFMHIPDRDGDAVGDQRQVNAAVSKGKDLFKLSSPRQRHVQGHYPDSISPGSAHQDAMETSSRRSIRSGNSHATPRSIKLTPLPKISLTPRGSATRNTPGDGARALPRFPSPDGNGGHPEQRSIDIGSSLFIESPPWQLPPPSLDDTQSLDLSVDEEPLAETYRIGGNNADDMQTPHKETFIPFPAWADAPPSQGTGQVDGVFHSPLVEFGYDQQQSAAVGTPSSQACGQSSSEWANVGKSKAPVFSSLSPRQFAHPAFMKEIVLQTGCERNDLDSLSEDDDDDAFLLASPSAIAQEKQRARQSSALRQPKLPRLPRSHDSGGAINNTDLESVRRRTSLASMASSNTSLKGMEFTPSFASLRGLDLAPSSTSLRGMEQVSSSASLRGMDLHQSSSSLRAMEVVGESRYGPNLPTQHRGLLRDDSPASIGLALDSCTLPCPDINFPAGRDLVTPPAIASAPRCPPPLSPRFLSSKNDDYGQHTPQSCGSENDDPSKKDSPPFMFVR